MNQTRQAAKDIGLQKQAAVYNMYAGLPAQAATATGLGMNSMQVGNASSAAGFGAQATGANFGMSALNSGMGFGNTAFGMGQGAMQNFSQAGAGLNAAAGQAMSGWGQVGQLGVGKYNADINAYNAQQAKEGAMWGGLGSAIGSGIALYAKTKGI